MSDIIWYLASLSMIISRSTHAVIQLCFDSNSPGLRKRLAAGSAQTQGAKKEAWGGSWSGLRTSIVTQLLLFTTRYGRPLGSPAPRPPFNDTWKWATKRQSKSMSWTFRAKGPSSCSLLQLPPHAWQYHTWLLKLMPHSHSLARESLDST